MTDSVFFKSYINLIEYCKDLKIYNKEQFISRILRITIEYCIYFQEIKNIGEVMQFLMKNNISFNTVDVEKSIAKLIELSSGLRFNGNFDEKIPNWQIGKKYDSVAMQYSAKFYNPIISEKRIEIQKESLEKLLSENPRKNKVEFVFGHIFSYYSEHKVDGKTYSLFSDPPLRYNFDEIADDTAILINFRSRLFLPYLISDFIPYICKTRKNITFLILLDNYSNFKDWVLDTSDFYFGINNLDKNFQYLLYKN